MNHKIYIVLITSDASGKRDGGKTEQWTTGKKKDECTFRGCFASCECV